MVTLEPRSFQIHVAGYLELLNSFKLQGQFMLRNDDEVIAVHMDAKFEAFGVSLLYVNGDAAIVKQGDVGFVANVVATMQSPIELEGIFELGADFRLKINTRGGTGSDAFDYGLERGSYFVSFVGDMKLLSVIEMHGSGFIEYSDGLFRMEVAMGFEILGSGVEASGFFSSEGEFELYVAGHLMIGFPGFGVQGDASFYISRLDDNGKDPYGDLNFEFNVHGYIGASLQLFGISLAGVNLSFGYIGSTGRVFVKPCVQILAWQACSDFTVMYIQPPPKVYLAGNADDTEGTAFAGGDLYLNMGPRAYLRNEQEDNIHEGFLVERVGPDADNGGEIVRVKAMGRTQTFRGVTKVIADGGSGHDYIEVGAGLSAPVEIRGGDRRDFIRNFASGTAVIDGGPGDDDVQGGFGDDTFVFADGFGRDAVTDLDGRPRLRFLASHRGHDQHGGRRPDHRHAVRLQPPDHRLRHGRRRLGAVAAEHRIDRHGAESQSRLPGRRHGDDRRPGPAGVLAHLHRHGRVGHVVHVRRQQLLAGPAGRDAGAGRSRFGRGHGLRRRSRVPRRAEHGLPPLGPAGLGSR